MARANRYTGRGGRIVVMTGDGELQEGQIWESLQPVANEKLAEIIVIVDHNKLQSDSRGVRRQRPRADRGQVPRVRLGSARAATATTPAVIRDVLARFATVTDQPKVFIADTIKGKGVSFMEGLACGDQTYHFHAGAPSLKDYLAATRSSSTRVNARLDALGQPPVDARARAAAGARHADEAGKDRARVRRRAARRWRATGPRSSSSTPICCPTAASRRSRRSCPIGSSSAASPSSTWCRRPAAWRCSGMLPVVHSFACFLSTRANEHIYNNATERRKIIYTATLAGLVPGGPGHSHQSVRDISAIGAVPGLVAFEPCSEREARLAIRWAVEENPDSTYLRFVNVPLDLPYALPADYALHVGRGVDAPARRRRRDRRLRPAAVDATRGARPTSSRRQGISAAVIDLPWLNRIDDEWVADDARRAIR